MTNNIIGLGTDYTDDKIYTKQYPKDIIETIQDLCELKNYTRKHQYQILEELTGISAGECRKICSLQRQIRFAIPADTVGLAKEKEYHMPDYLRS